MPPKPRWLLAIPDAISQLENLDRTLLTRRDIERLFGVSTARAATLMQTFGAEMTGYQRTLPKTQLLRQLRKHRARAAFRGEEKRRERLLDRAPEGPADRDPSDASRRDPRREVGELARGGVGFSGPDRGAVQRGEGGGERRSTRWPMARERLRAVREARRRGSRGRGRGVGMSESLVPATAEPVVVADGEADVVLPALIVDAGPDAVARFLEFFAGRIANERTRAAYGRAVGQFLAWCEARGLGLEAVSSLHVAAYIRTHPGSVPTVKQHLAAIRVLCDWLVVSQVLPVNPAGRGAGVEARRHQGRDASLDPGRGEEAPRAHRHGPAGRAPRPGALLGDALQRQDYFEQGSRGWLRLHEKGGKRHDVPAHHRVAEALNEYLDACGLEAGEALFQSVDRVGDRLTGRSLTRRVVLATIKRRAATAGLPPSTCCHTFRPTGITAYLSNGGTIEHAQQIAGHASPKTMKLYDRTADTVTVEEIERIVI